MNLTLRNFLNCSSVMARGPCSRRLGRVGVDEADTSASCSLPEGRTKTTRLVSIGVRTSNAERGLPKNTFRLWVVSSRSMTYVTVGTASDASFGRVISQ